MIHRASITLLLLTLVLTEWPPQSQPAPANQSTTSQSLDVKLLGAKADGTTDDTPTIQQAISSAPEGSIVTIPPGHYSVSGFIISSKSRLRITGGGTLHLRPPATPQGTFAFRLAGICSHIEIVNLSILGVGKVESHQAGIGNMSGETISDVSFHNLIIQDLVTGISLNANLSGSYKLAIVKDNSLLNIIGTDSGSGYGIHIANAEHSIIGNNILTKTQRHAIYHGRGSYNTICFNHISGHREGVSESAFRCAIVVARDSTGINVTGNTIEGSYDGGISIEGTTSGPLTVSDCSITQNVLINPKNAVPLIFCGEQTRQENVSIRNLSLCNNTLEVDASTVPAFPLLSVYFGNSVKISNNSIHIRNVSGEPFSAMLIGHGTYVNSMAFLQDFDISTNLIDITGKDTSKCIGIRLDPFISNTSGVRCKVQCNTYANHRGVTGLNYSAVWQIGRASNPYLEVSDSSSSTRAPAPPKAGYWVVGDLVYNENPAPNGPFAWICTKSGTPGTWATLLTVGASK